MEKIEIRATISRLGKVKNCSGEGDTILLLNVINNKTNELIRDHTWIKYAKRWKSLLKDIKNINNLEVIFLANLEEYFSNDLNKKLKLAEMRYIKIIGENNETN